MMYAKTKRISLIVMICVLISPNMLGAQKAFIIGSDTTYPPFESLDQTGKPIGMDIDIINAAAKAGGFSVVVKSVSWDSIFQQLQAGSIDAIISDITVLDSRKTSMDFSLSYYDSPQVLIVPKAVKNVFTLKDLKGKPVGVLRGSRAASLLKKDADGFGVLCVEYDEDPYKALIAGKLSGEIWESVGTATSMKDSNVATRIRIASALPFTEQTAVAVKKGNTKVLDAINRGLKAISDSGELGKILKKWIQY